jgi:pimeloyl-ACP methyl ester carboxylesterase
MVRTVRLTRPALRVLGLLLATYVVALAALFAFQRALLFPAPRSVRTPRAPGGSVVSFPSPSGPGYATWVAPAAEQPTVVFFHGNGEQLADDDDWAEALRERGVGLFAVEYPGYGLAGAQAASEASLHGSAEAALRHLTAELHVPREKTVLVGFSLGTGVATRLASRGFGSRLVLMAPYTSIPDVASRLLPMFPVRLLSRDVFDSQALAPSVSVPVLILHGTRDSVVPFELGQRLSTRFPHVKFEPIADADHLDLIERPSIVDRVVRFARSGD